MNSYSKRHIQDIDIKELIHRYKQYDCLWNYNSPNYKSKTLKQDAWQEIAKYFHKNASEVKRKIKYLRSAYVAEKRKVDLSRKSGTGAPYKPILFYYNELNFLDNIVVLRKLGNDADHTDLEFENAIISPNTEDDIKEPSINCKTESIDESESELPCSPQTPLGNSPKILYSRSLANRPVKRKISGEIKHNKSVSKIATSLTLNPNAELEKLYISYGKTLALQLRQLPMEVAILLMSEIQSLLTKKIVEHIKSLQNNHELLSESEDSCNELIEEAYDDSS